MSVLYVNAIPIDTDRRGNPEKRSFCQALFPMDWHKQREAESHSPETHITNVTEFLKLLSVKMNISLKELSEALSWKTEGRKRRTSQKERQKERYPSIFEFLSDDDDDDDDIFIEDDDDDEEEEIVEPDYTSLPKSSTKPNLGKSRKPLKHSKRSVIQKEPIPLKDRIQVIESSAAALSALGLFYREGVVDDFNTLIKNAAIPYIEGLKKNAHLYNHQEGGGAVQPEDPNEELVGVSQRIRQLGLRPKRYNVSAIGKRALELYKEAHPGCMPPQRVAVNKYGHEYVMNLYTPSICEYTVDVAVGEE